VKLRNVDPPSAVPQIIGSFCWALASSAAMLNLRVKQHIRPKEEKGK
jgi:hypothetical protein